MKKLVTMLTFFFIGILSVSCDDSSDDDSNVLTGSQSDMGLVGVDVSSSSIEIAGVSNFSAEVESLENGISSYTAQANVSNSLLKNMISNFPGVVIDGNTVSIDNFQIQQTTGGIKCMTGPLAGVLVNYDSAVGDTYTTTTSGKVRTVVSKSTEDDYPYGFYLIKTIQVESTLGNSGGIAGVNNITYIANHKFGMVGVKVDFEDGTSAKFPIYTNAEN
jgi:hypothetical protein